MINPQSQTLIPFPIIKYQIQPIIHHESLITRCIPITIFIEFHKNQGDRILIVYPISL